MKSSFKDPTGLVQALDYAHRRNSESSYESRTGLDSHANMPVVGKNALIIEDLGIKVDVSPFSPDYPALETKLVDAVVQYECPYTHDLYMLVIRNAIYVPSMEVNLLPPFVMREAGVVVNDVPKIQINDPSNEDHAIIFDETGFRIPLKLNGVFSYFPTSKPTYEELDSNDNIYVLTPNKFDPNSEAYAHNEERLIDWEGNVVPRRRSNRVLLSEIPEDPNISSTLAIGDQEEKWLDKTFEDQEEEQDQDKFETPWEADEVNRVLVGLSFALSAMLLEKKTSC